MPPGPALDAVRELARKRIDGLIERIVAELQHTIPRYRTLEVETLKRAVRILTAAR